MERISQTNRNGTGIGGPSSSMDSVPEVAKCLGTTSVVSMQQSERERERERAQRLTCRIKGSVWAESRPRGEVVAMQFAIPRSGTARRRDFVLDCLVALW